MKKVNTYSLPLAFNICDQMLREVEKIPDWTMAHVTMNPRAWSLLHEHHVTEEAYIITRGSGQLVVGKKIYSVQAGDVVWIPTNTPHSLTNTSAGRLEHLVLATPPFNPKDVYLLEEAHRPTTTPVPFDQPEASECFDGAKIIAYDRGDIVSIAFGWVINDKSRRKSAHYHKKATEWIFVVEGNGVLEIGGQVHCLLNPGSWVQIDPGELHALRNYHESHMVVVCVCSPCFDMEDVYFK